MIVTAAIPHNSHRTTPHTPRHHRTPHAYHAAHAPTLAALLPAYVAGTPRCAVAQHRRYAYGCACARHYAVGWLRWFGFRWGWFGCAFAVATALPYAYLPPATAFPAKDHIQFSPGMWFMCLGSVMWLLDLLWLCLLGYTPHTPHLPPHHPPHLPHPLPRHTPLHTLLPPYLWEGYLPMQFPPHCGRFVTPHNTLHTRPGGIWLRTRTRYHTTYHLPTTTTTFTTWAVTLPSPLTFTLCGHFTAAPTWRGDTVDQLAFCTAPRTVRAYRVVDRPHLSHTPASCARPPGVLPSQTLYPHTPPFTFHAHMPHATIRRCLRLHHAPRTHTRLPAVCSVPWLLLRTHVRADTHHTHCLYRAFYHRFHVCYLTGLHAVCKLLPHAHTTPLRTRISLGLHHNTCHADCILPPAHTWLRLLPHHTARTALHPSPCCRTTCLPPHAHTCRARLRSSTTAYPLRAYARTAVALVVFHALPARPYP